MFPRRQRLSRAAFPHASKGGKRITLPYFALSASNEALGHAVIVSKQVARLSVTRHRVKRQVSAILRTLELPPSLIVYARAGAPKRSFAQIKEELEAGLKHYQHK
jgi:ribonuclease P protein component